MAKSEFVSAFDIAASIFKSLSNEVRNLGGGDEDLRRLETDGERRRAAAQIIVNGVPPAKEEQEVKPLLTFVRQASVPEIKKFSAADVLKKVGLNRDGVRIAGLGENFKAQFGKMVEENTPATELVVNRLERYADAINIAGAVPREKRPTTIGQIYGLVLAQKDGGDGPLLTNGWANLFLAYGEDGNLWLVYVYLLSDGWDFYAYPLGDSRRWFDGDQVFFRK